MKTLRKRGLALTALLFVAGAAGGQPAVVQQAPGTIPSSTFPNSQGASAAAGAPQPAALPTRTQANEAFRWAYAMDTANKAAQLGAILGGPFGGPASMGMGVLGLLYGAVAAESKLAEENARAQGQYQTETTKDQQLEAAIEKELERQRAFDNQVAGATGSAAGSEPEIMLRHLPQPVSAPAGNGSGIALAALTSPASFAPAPFRNVEIKDLNHDGIADLWVYYSPQKAGEVLRQEESSKMDGRVDTWSYFKEGKLVRRDVDNRGNGRPDAVYYYDDEKIVREERDEADQGRITYRADYQDGRLSRVERETRGKDRPDLWTTYDTSVEGEIIAKEERDLNGDGFPDLLSHYERGRLVRRDLNPVGLEFFSQQEETPLGAVDNRQRNFPDS